MKAVLNFRILPLLVIVAGLSLTVRIGEFAAGFNQGGVAFAQQETKAEPPPLSDKLSDNKQEKETIEPSEKGHPPALEKEKGASVHEEGGAPAASPTLEDVSDSKKEWKDAGESTFEYSELKEELYKDLVSRREEIEKREQELAKREALLEAAGRELDQKVREMTAVRNEIEGMLKAQSEQEQAQVASLVRIYEGMKAKDAARIFNTLDMDVLIAVLSRMSERKSAPIIAEMSEERARSVTILMAQQKQLPDIPPQ